MGHYCFINITLIRADVQGDDSEQEEWTMNMPLNKLTSNSGFKKVQLGINTDLPEAKKKKPHKPKQPTPPHPPKKNFRKYLGNLHYVQTQGIAGSYENKKMNKALDRGQRYWLI